MALDKEALIADIQSRVEKQKNVASEFMKSSGFKYEIKDSEYSLMILLKDIKDGKFDKKESKSEPYPFIPRGCTI